MQYNSSEIPITPKKIPQKLIGFRDMRNLLFIYYYLCSSRNFRKYFRIYFETY